MIFGTTSINIWKPQINIYNQYPINIYNQYPTNNQSIFFVAQHRHSFWIRWEPAKLNFVLIYMVFAKTMEPMAFSKAMHPSGWSFSILPRIEAISADTKTVAVAHLRDVPHIIQVCISAMSFWNLHHILLTWKCTWIARACMCVCYQPFNKTCSWFLHIYVCKYIYIQIFKYVSKFIYVSSFLIF